MLLEAAALDILKGAYESLQYLYLCIITLGISKLSAAELLTEW